jgi:2-haloacid dehalogenase
MGRVIVFDVNETLLDLSALDEVFKDIFGDVSARHEWFGQFIQSALVATVTERYAPFGQIGMNALTMIAQRWKVALSDADRQAVGVGLMMLPPHEDVPPALERLHKAGYRLAALTNSTLAVAEAQLNHAGLRPLFERVFSADTVRRLKPAAQAYFHAAESMGVEIGEMRLVAAHAWDIAGALQAGCAAAFVARPGMVLDPNAPMPDIVGVDMEAVVDQIALIDTP